ncbi:MAG: hypothetical protein COC01_02255 [Bacteroidetes bacterium]|nr:MAG: hypothetical protein COC01_02255 [Bacteroidota bacterium]
MNPLSFSTKFILKTDKEDIDGLAPIYLRIIANRQIAELSIKRKIPLVKWDAQSAKPKGNPALTSYMTTILNDIDAIHTELVKDKKEISAKVIKDIYTGKDSSVIYLLSYMNQHIQEITQLTNEYAPSTIQKYNIVYNHLQEFVTKCRRLEDIPLRKIDIQFINELDFYLKTVKKHQLNTATKILSILKVIINKALSNKLILHSPFKGFKLKYDTNRREYLTNEELQSLITTKLHNDGLEKVRQIFLFGVYSGLRFSDILELTPNNIVIDLNRRKWISYYIGKTKQQHRIPLLKPAEKIINKYKEHQEKTGKLLPVFSNQKTNAYLKAIAELCGIEKRLTFHCSRHTLATTILLGNNMSKEVVQAFLAHQSVTTTEIYAKITQDFLWEATKDINKKLANNV